MTYLQGESVEGGLERCETAPGSILCASAVACNRCNKSSIMPALSFALSLSPFLCPFRSWSRAQNFIISMRLMWSCLSPFVAPGLFPALAPAVTPGKHDGSDKCNWLQINHAWYCAAAVQLLSFPLHWFLPAVSLGGCDRCLGLGLLWLIWVVLFLQRTISQRTKRLRERQDGAARCLIDCGLWEGVYMDK